MSTSKSLVRRAQTGTSLQVVLWSHHALHQCRALVRYSLLTFMPCWPYSSAEPDADGGMPRLVDIADDRLAVRVPNAAGDASNYVLGGLPTLCRVPLPQTL